MKSPRAAREKVPAQVRCAPECDGLLLGRVVAQSEQLKIESLGDFKSTMSIDLHAEQGVRLEHLDANPEKPPRRPTLPARNFRSCETVVLSISWEV
jgi:hypothetical protein